MVTLLLRYSANPNLFDSQGYNALHLAAHAGHHLLLLYLNATGMDWSTPDSAKRTVLHWIAYQGNSEDAMTVVLEANPDKDFIDRVDASGFTALHWAIIAHHFAFAKLLLSAGARKDIEDGKGKTAKNWAEERGKIEKWNTVVEGVELESLSSLPYTKVLFCVFNCDKPTTLKIVFALPFAIMAGGITLLSLFQWYISLPLVFIYFWGMYNPLMRGYLLGRNITIPVIQTPFMAAIPIATVFFGFIDWVRWLPCLCLYPLNNKIPAHHLQISS